jgi:serine/threonine-protein kinase
MNESHDPNRTVDVSSAPADSLDAGLAAGFGSPRSSLGDMRPVLLKEAEGESAHVVKPNSDAMPPREQTGDRYQLQGEIARGGMGAVLRGRDVDLGRDLAVKILLEKYANRPDVARRFIEEAQIGGQLQHPGVVPVYDIGRFGDRPFFTMKLVKGQTLLALLAERPDPSVDRPRFLAIALQVAQALAYAHAKGVIHRDLKPANVMVGAFGEVQVMDWGLAKVLAEGGSADEGKASRQHQEPEGATRVRTARSSGTGGGSDTEVGALLGTPTYMPPEQANGEVDRLDRRADVFGLGATLCEILTGRPPYVGRSSEEVRRKAANGDLRDAMSRLDGCGADEELIGLTRRCLAPEPADRPADAREVAEGLTGYLDGAQERLRQAELAEAEARARAIEEARRRRLTVALAATVLLALTLGGVSWLYLKADRDARTARLTREINEAIQQATTLREEAKSAPTGGAALFARAREQVQRALALVQSGPADEAVKEQVRWLKEELDEQERDHTLVVALDAARLEQAQPVSGQHRYAQERAVPKFREAFAAYGMPAGQGEAVAVAGRIRGRPAAVREAILAALEEWDEVAGNRSLRVAEPHRRWLRAVLESAEADDEWGKKVRATSSARDTGRRDAALEAVAASARGRELPAGALVRLARRLEPARAAALLRQAQRRYPADFWVNHDLGVALLEMKSPEHAEAVRFLTAAVALRPASPAVHINLGIALQSKGQREEAIACYKKAIALDRKLAAAHDILGLALQDGGKVEEAIACFKKAIALDPKDSRARHNLAVALADQGKLEEAIACNKKLVALDPGYAPAHFNLGLDLKRQGKVEEAIGYFEKALALDPKLARAQYHLGLALKGRGKVKEAIACFKKAIELEPEDAKVAHHDLGIALAEQGKPEEAIACYKKVITLDPKFAPAHYNLGNALKGKGELEGAVACYQKAIELAPKYAPAHHNLGLVLKDRGQVEEAIACYRQAIDIDARYTQAYLNLGVALADRGAVEGAVGCFRKVIEIDPKHAKAYLNLALLLRRQGRFAESLAAMRRGHELGSKQPGWHYPSAAWVRLAERLADLEAKLPAFLKGELKPTDRRERLGLIGVCQAKKLHHAATRLYADAFAADAKLVENATTALRYTAACQAALASAGKGEDAGKLDDQERARLRKQALDWLRGDLLLLAAGEIGRSRVARTLGRWQKDPDLAGLRDEAALAKLPAEERAACEKLWADVAALLKKAEQKTK